MVLQRAGLYLDTFIADVLSPPADSRLMYGNSFANIINDTMTIVECTVTYLITPSVQVQEMLTDSNTGYRGLLYSGRYALDNGYYTDTHSFTGGGYILFEDRTFDNTLRGVLLAPVNASNLIAPSMPVGVFLIIVAFMFGVLNKLIKLVI